MQPNLVTKEYLEISFNVFFIDHNEDFDSELILRKRKRTALGDDMGKFWGINYINYSGLILIVVY